MLGEVASYYQMSFFFRMQRLYGYDATATSLALTFQVNMAISILPMAEAYSWDSATMGVVQSSFFWGYLLTQVRNRSY
jgi:hypothetical protein